MGAEPPEGRSRYRRAAFRSRVRYPLAAVAPRSPRLDVRAVTATSLAVIRSQVVNGTPAGGKSEKQVEGVGRAYNYNQALKAAEKDVDNKMPPGRHKRHCHVIK